MRFKQFAKGFVRNGFQVRINSFFPSVFSNYSEWSYTWEKIPFQYLSRTGRYTSNKLKRLSQIIRAQLELYRYLKRAKHTNDLYLFFNPRVVDGLFGVWLLRVWGKQPIVDQVELFSTRYPSMRWQEKLIARYTDILIVNSDSLLNHFSEMRVGQRTEMIPVMVDLERFADHRRSDQTFIIGYLGNFDKKDNIEQLLKAFASTHLPVKLKLMGYNPHKAEVSHWIADNNLEERVMLTGMLKYEDVAKELAECDGLVLNRNTDIFSGYGFPVKLAEYLATGRPVLMSAIGTYDRYFSHGENAIIFEPENIDALSDAIHYLYSDLERAKRMGEAGLKVAKSMFTTTHIDNLIKTL